MFEAVDIIDRKPGFDNLRMVEELTTLLQISSKTIGVKSGRGSKATIDYIPKYKVEPEVLDKLERSISYYKSMHDKQASRTKHLRDTQRVAADAAKQILYDFGFVYLAMEVRTGKTLTSIAIAEEMYAKNVLFITKKKGIANIEKDFMDYKPAIDYYRIINYGSLHLVVDEVNWDFVIIDEAHSLGAYPKPSVNAKIIKDILSRYKPKVILMSGTPTPESYSQMYHQVYGIHMGPFREYKNFYRFADDFVDVKKKIISGNQVNSYDKGLPSIIERMSEFTVTMTQKEAGFSSSTKEIFLEVEMKPWTYNMIDRLRRDLVINGKDEVILADSSVKLQSKLHQMYSGTVKFESGRSMVIDHAKAQYIYDNFSAHKIGIFYKFAAELDALMKVFGDELTTDLDVFRESHRSIALHIVSGRESISLKEADFLVYYNMDFSATSYWQSRDRMTTIDRLENTIYYVFTKGGIESDIYKCVSKKKNYTLNHFKKKYVK